LLKSLVHSKNNSKIMTLECSLICFRKF